MALCTVWEHQVCEETVGSRSVVMDMVDVRCCSPLVCPERLWKLVCELSPTIDVEFSEEDEGTVGALCQGHCGRSFWSVVVLRNVPRPCVL